MSRFITGSIAAITMMSPVAHVSATDLSPAWYIGGGIGSSWLDVDTTGTTYSISDDQDFAWHLLAGYRIDTNFSVELAYTDLGNAGVEDFSTGASAGEISYRQTTLGVLLSPTMDASTTWRPYMKGGINYSDHDWNQGDLIKDKWSGFWGVGIEKFIGSHDMSVRAESTAYTEDAWALNLSLIKYFPD